MKFVVILKTDLPKQKFSKKKKKKRVYNRLLPKLNTFMVFLVIFAKA